jgi:ubiquinone biosynthesis protein
MSLFMWNLIYREKKCLTEGGELSLATPLGIRRRYRHLRRYRQIVEILIKHGFGFVLEHLELGYLVPFRKRVQREQDTKGIPLPARLRMVLEELGVTFIKFGQLLSTRPDIVPASIIRELEKLQDAVPTVPFQDIREIIEKELKGSLEEIFLDFDPEPLAGASIGQVYRAHLAPNRQVVLKVQRPGVAQQVTTDLEILQGIAHMVEERIPYFSALELVDQFRMVIYRELDYTREGLNIDRFRRNFAKRPYVHIPQVYWSHTTPRVLTMEYIEGTKLSELEEKADPNLKKLIAQRGARAFMEQILVDGYFHGDPHPGNILVADDNRIALIDFGVVGRIGEKTMDGVAAFFLAVIDHDVDKVIKGLQRLKIIGDEETGGLRDDLIDLIDRHYDKSLQEINIGIVIQEILDVTRRYRLRIPADFLLLVKVLLTLEGVGRSLDPQFNVLTNAQPFARELIKRRMQPQRIWKEVSLEAKDHWELFWRLPRSLDRILTRAGKDQLALRFKHEGLERLIIRLDIASNRLSFGMIIAALIIGSSLIMLTDRGPQLWGFPAIGILGFSLAGFVGLWLILSILRSGKL